MRRKIIRIPKPQLAIKKLKNAYAETNHSTHGHAKAAAPTSVSSEPAAQNIYPLDFTNINGMTPREYLWGGLTSTVFGFGAGHALQGRYFDNGWLGQVRSISSISSENVTVFAGLLDL